MIGPQKHIGVLGGSFNPVHAGHIMLASYIAQFTPIDEVWMMLSPANPLKNSSALLPDSIRLEMLKLACRDYPSIIPCDIELSMPRPSYTIDSLSRLAALHPDCQFHLIIGTDNWLIFDRWRSHDEILERFSPIIYPRPGYEIDPTSINGNATFVNAPTIDISSTFIRESINKNFDMKAFLPPDVASFIESHGLYKYFV